MTAHTEALLKRAAHELESPLMHETRKPHVQSWIVFSLAVIVAFFGLTFSRISLDRSAFVLEDLEQQIEEQAVRQGELRVEVARLQAPERISGIADDMGLVYPAELIALVVPQSDREESSVEYQWARLQSLQTAHP
jgi:cell division protein FtsL